MIAVPFCEPEPELYNSRIWIKSEINIVKTILKIKMLL